MGASPGGDGPRAGHTATQRTINIKSQETLQLMISRQLMARSKGLGPIGSGHADWDGVTPCDWPEGF